MLAPFEKVFADTVRVTPEREDLGENLPMDLPAQFQGMKPLEALEGEKTKEWMELFVVPRIICTS